MKLTKLILLLAFALGVPVAALGQSTVFYTDPTLWSQQLTTSPTTVVFPNPDYFSAEVGSPFTVNGVTFTDPAAGSYMVGTHGFIAEYGGTVPLTITLPNLAYAVAFNIGNYQCCSDNMTITLDNGATQNFQSGWSQGVFTFFGAVSTVGFTTISIVDNGPYVGNGGLFPFVSNIQYVLATPISMGPQAMEGNLTLSPGVMLQAGYDFTMPGNHPTASVSFIGAKVAFEWTCVSGAGSGTLIVPMADQSYTDAQNSPAWYPSGDQNSSLVYQGSIAVPNVCSGGLVSFRAGGTFSAGISSTDTTDKVNVRWHYSGNGSAGGWSGTKSVVPK
jgi:hypothetical protein